MRVSLISRNILLDVAKQPKNKDRISNISIFEVENRHALYQNSIKNILIKFLIGSLHAKSIGQNFYLLAKCNSITQ